MTGFPIKDGTGPLPDSRAEVAADLLIVFVVGGLLVFTGLDAQVEYAVTAPQDYFLSSVEDQDDVIVFTSSEVDGLNFATSNRIGYDRIGDEIGLCGGLRNGDVYNLRVAEGFESTSPTSVTFSCGLPRDVAIHSQPGFESGFSEEDLSFDGEFRPDVSCIIFREATVSPVTGKISGLNCIDTVSGNGVIPVVQ